MTAARALAAALIVALLASAPVSAGDRNTPERAGAAVATDLTPTTIGEIYSDYDPKPVGRTTQLRATVEPADTGGTVTWLRRDGDTETELATVPVVTMPGVNPHWSFATLDFPAALGPGAHRIVARFNGHGNFAASTSEEFVQDVGPRPTTTRMDLYPSVSIGSLIVGRDEHLTIQAQTEDAHPPSNGLPPSGSISILLDGVVIHTETMFAGLDIDLATLGLGQHTIQAAYGGSVDYAPSSISKAITVVAGTVQASGIGLDLTRFYPIADGYRDVVKAVGERLEPASVKVVVYSSTGTVRKRLSVAMGSGRYSVAWNSRTASGSLLASGKYRVVQTLTDLAGSTRIVTSYVTLSKRKLIINSVNLTKRGTSYSAKGTNDTGKISASSSGYLKMSAGSSFYGWAGAGWQFKLPSAVFYKSMSFKVDAIAPASTGQNLIGLQDFRTCPLSSADWLESCFGRWKAISSLPRKWHSQSGASYNRSGRYVRGMVSVHGTDMRVYRVRVKVTYGVWAS